MLIFQFHSVRGKTLEKFGLNISPGRVEITLRDNQRLLFNPMALLDAVDKNIPILVVDDFNTMRRIVKTCLRQIGLENITEAEDGQVALTKLQSGEFKLIISDWNMPNMMGIDLLKAVRADPKLKPIPFLMVTAEGQKENILEAAKSGVSNYVVKPFTADTLQQKLEAIFCKK